MNPESSTPTKPAPPWGTVLLAVATLVFFVGFASATAARLGSGVPLTSVEPQPLWALQRIAAGEPLYRDFRVERPAVPLTYGPLAYWLPGLAARALGVSGGEGLLTLGRGFTLVGTLAVFAFAAVAARQRGATWHFACLAGAPLPWLPYAAEWLVKLNPDSMALAASLAGLVLAGPPGVDKRWRLGAAIACWLAALALKPTIIAGPVAFGVERLLAARALAPGERRAALAPVAIAAGSVIAGALALAALFQAATGGVWKLHAVDAMAACEFRFGNAVEALAGLRGGTLATAAEWPALLGGGGGLLLAAVWAAARATASPLFVAALALGLVQLLLMSKQGGNVNYLLGPLALFGIATASDLPRAPRLVQPLAAAIAALLLLDAPRSARATFEMPAVPTREDFERAAALARQLGDRTLVLDGPLAAWADLPAPWMDGYHAAILQRAGLADFTPELRALQDGRTRVVLSNAYAWAGASWHGQTLTPGPFLDELRARWTPARIGPWTIALQRAAPVGPDLAPSTTMTPARPPAGSPSPTTDP